MENREILFRAINANGEFIYGLPYTDTKGETMYFDEYSNGMCWRDEKGIHCNQPYKNGTLEQFTGLLDKNGTKIFEGDVVGFTPADGERRSGIIKYNFDGFDIVCGQDECSIRGFRRTFSKENPTTSIEIIGNIHNIGA